MLIVELILDGILLITCAVCVYTDVHKHLIYDWITYPALGLGMLVRFLAYGTGAILDLGLVSAVVGAAFCFLLFGLFLLWGKGMGWGDVKLMAAVGALSGLSQSLFCAMYIAVVGASVGLVLLIFRKRILARQADWLKRAFTIEVDQEIRVIMPYGLAVFFGCAWAVMLEHSVLQGC